MRAVTIEDVYYAVLLFALCSAAIGWFLTKIANEKIQRQLVESIVTSHMPYVYKALRQIADNQGVALDDPPQIGVVKVNGSKRKVWDFRSE